jgi:hypothetical protein
MIADMNDRIPTGYQQDTTVGLDHTGGTRQDATVTVIDAARILGVSTDAVRARLRRGTLEGEKIEGEWHVRLPHRQDADRTSAEPTGTQQDGTGIRPAEQQDSDRIPTVVDLTPLTELIERQAKELADLREAGTFLTIRNRHLEDRLKQLTSGEIVPGTVPEPPGAPRTNETGPRGVWGRVRRWIVREG